MNKHNNLNKVKLAILWHELRYICYFMNGELR